MRKNEREQVFNKYGGRCAYCGCELKKGWHVDHIDPHWHNWTEEETKRYGFTKGANDIANYNPSCPRCNKWKSTYPLDDFRREISLQIERLNKYNPNYRMAKDYGLLTENNNEVRFYFEYCQEPINS